MSYSADAVARRERLGARRSGRPVAGRPGVAAGDLVPLQQPRVRLVPLRPLPAATLEERRAERLLALVERRRAQRPRVLHRLERVEDVVDLDEVLDAAVVDVRRRSWCGSKRLRSHSWRSVGDPPSTSHSAIALPTPAEWVTQTASATQKPATSRDSPISGMPSGVNENTPSIPSSTRRRCARRAGHGGLGPPPRLREVLRGQVEHRRHDGRLGRRAAGPMRRSASAMAVRADPHPVDVLAGVEVAVLVPEDRLRRPRARAGWPSRRARGPARSSRTGGRAAGAGWPCRPSPRPRPPDPGARDDHVRGDLALVRDDGPHAAVVGPDAGHGALPDDAGTALDGAAGLPRGPDRLGQPVGRDEVAAQHDVAVEQRRDAHALVGVEQPGPSSPTTGPSRGDGAGRRDAPAVVATSRPPTCRKHHCPSSFSPQYFATV